MVSGDEERYDVPAYNLARVVELANNGFVKYLGRETTRDVLNLGYSPEDVAACIAMLEPNDFRGSVRYVSTGIRFDIYRISVRFERHIDELFIKLMLSRDCCTVVLGSFHRREL